MNRFLLTALMLFTMCSVASSQPKAKPSRGSEVEEKLMLLERDWSTAYITHDTSVAERIMADEYVGIDGRGIVTNKKQEIDDVRGPEPGTPAPAVLTLMSQW